MKKIILCLSLLFCVTGCNVEYELNIDDLEKEEFSEQFKIFSENLDESNQALEDAWPLNAYYNQPYISEIPTILDDVDYYNKQTFLENSYTNLAYSYHYPSTRFSQANSVNLCFQSFYKNSDDGITYIKTSKEFLCWEKYPEISNLKIIVTVKNDVYSNNADEVIDNKYIWHIDETNYKNKPIELSYKNRILETEQKKDTKNSNFFLVSMIMLLFIIFIIGAFVYNLKKQNHK